MTRPLRETSSHSEVSDYTHLPYFGQSSSASVIQLPKGQSRRRSPPEPNHRNSQVTAQCGGPSDPFPARVRSAYCDCSSQNTLTSAPFVSMLIVIIRARSSSAEIAAVKDHELIGLGYVRLIPCRESRCVSQSSKLNWPFETLWSYPHFLSFGSLVVRTLKSPSPFLETTLPRQKNTHSPCRIVASVSPCSRKVS